MEPHIATRKLRLATLLENDLFVRLPRGVTAARTKLAVQRWQSVHVLSTLQTFITWPPSPGRATCLVQERSDFSVIVAGTTEQFLFFFTSVCWGSGVGRNSCAAVLLLCMFCLEQTSMSSVWYLSNVVMVCSVCFFYLTYSEQLGRVGTSQCVSFACNSSLLYYEIKFKAS